MATFEMTVLERETARLVASGKEHMPARFAVSAVKIATTAHVLVSNVNVELACDNAISAAMQRDTVFPPLYFLFKKYHITNTTHARTLRKAGMSKGSATLSVLWGC
jgi:hypothetical protein